MSKIEDEIKKKYKELFGETSDENETNTNNEKTKEENPKVVVQFPDKPTIEVPVYEKMEYNPKTDEEISQDATNQLSEYKNSALESYDIEYNNTKEQKERDKLQKEEERLQNETKVNETYDEKSKKIDYDLIKRGMVNSSSNELLKEENEEQREKAIAMVANEYSQAIEKIDNDIQKAENKRLQAIAEFNISYALKYSNLVSKLKAERDEMSQKALEYNNKIAQQEYEDKINKEKTESKLYSDALDQFEQKLDIENKQQAEEEKTYEYKIYNVLRSQLASMSKEDAYNALRNDSTYADNLSTKYYLQLLEEFGR